MPQPKIRKLVLAKGMKGRGNFVGVGKEIRGEITCHLVVPRAVRKSLSSSSQFQMLEASFVACTHVLYVDSILKYINKNDTGP